MMRKRMGTLAWLAVAFGAVAPAALGAESVAGWGHKGKCPPPHYSPLHYWVPQLYRICAEHKTPKGLYAPHDCHTDVPISGIVAPYPCPPVPPAELPSPYLPARTAPAQ
jgi:hypothetical protein